VSVWRGKQDPAHLARASPRGVYHIDPFRPSFNMCFNAPSATLLHTRSLALLFSTSSSPGFAAPQARFWLFFCDAILFIWACVRQRQLAGLGASQGEMGGAGRERMGTSTQTHTHMYFSNQFSFPKCSSSFCKHFTKAQKFS
jgi:hypothetical protein